MAQHDATSIGLCGLTIAGVRFAFAGPVNAAAFPPAFQPFRDGSSSADLGCEVFCRGPDDTMMSQPPAPGEPWSFAVRENGCTVIRRNQEGDVRWQIAGPLAFETATVSWNPLRFVDVYGSFERTLSMGIGLSLLVLRLRAHGGLVLHGMAAEVDGQGILCAGISGRGKSTLSRLLEAADARVLTDERPVLRQWPPPETGVAPTRAFRVYGSPWPSSAGYARNAWAPLRRLYFLEHGETDRITPLAAREAVRRLIPVTTIPWQSPDFFDPCLATLDALVGTVPCAVLAFRPTLDVADLIRADLRKTAGRT